MFPEKGHATNERKDNSAQMRGEFERLIEAATSQLNLEDHIYRKIKAALDPPKEAFDSKYGCSHPTKPEEITTEQQVLINQMVLEAIQSGRLRVALDRELAAKVWLVNVS